MEIDISDSAYQKGRHYVYEICQSKVLDWIKILYE